MPDHRFTQPGIDDLLAGFDWLHLRLVLGGLGRPDFEPLALLDIEHRVVAT
jgi:hypothetical protein